MLWSRRWIGLISCITFVFLFERSLGCRYNVRETGFVEAGIRTLVLVCCVNDETPVGFGRAFLEEAEDVLESSTLTYELVNVDLQPDHPALDYLSEEGRQELPTLVLVSREGGSTEVPFSPSGEEYTDILRSSLERVVETPFRRELAENLARHYGVVLMVDGENVQENKQALQSARAAVDAIEGQRRFMPKPIRYGPVVMRMDVNSLSEEFFLLWSLGVAENPRSGPYCAVVYGKARLIGPVLQGPEIGGGMLLRLLAIVGADCECGLDPRLIRGRPLPIKWNQSLHRAVVDDLGFDPDNPLVRIEVGHILRMRGSLFPTDLPERERLRVNELPVPLVEDGNTDWVESAVNDPILMNVLYSLAGLGVLVIGTGLLILRKGRRKA